MEEDIQPGVYIVGAGPGAPGLLTLRAAEVLRHADFVLYDQLVPKRLLDFANPKAEFICVRDLPGQHPDKYPHIHTLLIDRARMGQRVVRLKGGDPQIFGRGGEETDMLRQAGIPYEIVPGVTAALAAAAYLDIPLTHRHVASACALVTGHELPQKPGHKLDWEALAKFPGTLVIYMGISRLPLILAELAKYGKDPATPAAIVERASTGDMRTITSTLGTLEADRRQAGLEAPGLIIIGEAIRRKPELSWFESQPLFGKRVLVTRPRHQAQAMIAKLESLGAVAHALPVITIEKLKDTAPLDAAIESLSQFTWLVLTSANGVTHFLNRLLELGHDLRKLGNLKLACIGPATAAALAEYHLKADVMPAKEFTSEGLLEALLPRLNGQKVLLARANRGRDQLPAGLATVCDVTQVTAYEQHDDIPKHHDVLDHLRRGEIEYVTLSSTNIAKAFLAACDDVIKQRILRNDIKMVSISPVTTTAIASLGFPVLGEAAVATEDGLIDELRRLAISTA